jgi:hypothetical protein
VSRKREQHLDPWKRDPKLVQQLDQLAVDPLRLILVWASALPIIRHSGRIPHPAAISCPAGRRPPAAKPTRANFGAKEEQVKKALTFVAVAMLAGLAGAFPASASAKDAHRKVMTVRMVATSTFYVDNDPSGQSGGDLFGSEGDVRRRGRKIGTYSSACTASSATVGQCQATISWHGGDSLQLEGSFHLDQAENRLAIVGGTGRFRGTWGDGVVTRTDPQSPSQRVRLTIIRR